MIDTDYAYCPAGKISDMDGCKDIVLWIIDSNSSLVKEAFPEYEGSDSHFIEVSEEYANLTLDETITKSIDVKIDDGDVTTGKFRVGIINGAYWWDNPDLLLDF